MHLTRAAGVVIASILLSIIFMPDAHPNARVGNSEARTVTKFLDTPGFFRLNHSLKMRKRAPFQALPKEKATECVQLPFENWRYLPLLTWAGPRASCFGITRNLKELSGRIPSLESRIGGKNLLKEVKYLSGKLKNDASTLESYRWQTQLGWQTHAHQLNLMREHINEIGKRLDRLQAIKSEVAPWQQQAIEQIVPVAANVAAHTESAIQHLSENRTYLFAPVYADHLTSIANGSAELKESADVFLEFGDNSHKLDRMQHKLHRFQERIGLSES